MKAYTDLEQSKKLAEILPLESADMYYSTWTIVSEDGEFIVSVNQQGETIEELQREYGNQIIPCWSLASLLGIIPEPVLTYIDENNWNISIFDDNHFKDEVISSNPIDACYEMIINLHEQKLL